MSEAQFADNQETVEVDAAAFQQLVERVDDLEEAVEEKDERIEELEAEVSRNSTDLIGLSGDVGSMRKLLIGDGHDDAAGAMRELRESKGSINQQIAQLSQEIPQFKDDINDDIVREVGVLRAEHGSMIRQLADETDVDLSLSTGDKITQVREDGIDAVRSSPRKRDRRAEIVLKNIEEWGTKEKLRAGKAYRLPRPRVKRLLNGTDGVEVKMTSKTVGDIFDAVEELGEGTPRLVKRRKQDGTDNLYVGFSDTMEE